MSNTNFDAKIELEDGSLIGLAIGAQMTTESSIVEYVDNAEDVFAENVIINIDNNTHTLTIASNEKNTLKQSDAKNTLFKVGTGKKLKTKKNGVGKYNIGFKYSGAFLIGEGNKGTVRVDSIPENGEPWSVEEFIDYTNPNNYTDQRIVGRQFKGIDDNCNFKVTIKGCRYISIKEIIRLKINLGIRYREKIISGKTRISINGDVIQPIDRLYSYMKKRVNYSGIKYLKWKGDEYAATFEWSDLKVGNIQEDELCYYDRCNGINGRNKGVNVSQRSGVEIAINGVTIIPDNILESICGKEKQPSSSSFRGRLNILNVELADSYIVGCNKSKSDILKSFINDEENRYIFEYIRECHREFLRAHENDKDNNPTMSDSKMIKKWFEEEGISEYKVFFVEDRPEIEAVVKNTEQNYIVINKCNEVFNGIGNLDMTILSSIGEIHTLKEAYRTLSDFIHKFKQIKNG